MAVITRTGKVLLNPSERAYKYSMELKSGKALTNDLRKKNDLKTGKQIKLTKEQRAYRSGYLSHQKDSCNAFKSKHPNYKRKTG